MEMPLGKLYVQVEPQFMPAGELVTDPEPPSVTARAYRLTCVRLGESKTKPPAKRGPARQRANGKRQRAGNNLEILVHITQIASA